MPGICGSSGFYAYSPTDLAPYGYISRKLIFEYPDGKAPTTAQLQHPKPGQVYKQVPARDDNGAIIYDPATNNPKMRWIDQRTLLPSTGIIVDFFFRMKTRSTNISIAGTAEESGNSLLLLGAYGGGTGMLGVALANTRFLGGIDAVKNKQVWHLLSSRTYFDLPVKITDEIKKTGIIELPGYVVSILGVFEKPLNLTKEQKAKIGEPLNGRSSRGYQGDTNARGIFNGQMIDGNVRYGGEALPPIFPPSSTQKSRDVFNQKNLLKDVLKDARAIVFRADNQAILSPWGWQHASQNFNDIGSKKIQIDVSAFQNKKDVTVYITACLAKRRIMREMNLNKVTFVEMPDPSPVGRGGSPQSLGRSNNDNILPIKTVVNSYHYTPVKFRVKKMDLLEANKFPPLNANYLNSVQVDVSIFNSEYNGEVVWDVVEGWRINEIIDLDTLKIFAADSKGIHLLERGQTTVPDQTTNIIKIKVTNLIPVSDLTGQKWWDDFLTNNGLTSADYQLNGIKVSEFTGVLFDVSEHVSSILPDAKKIPYQRALADAIAKAPKSTADSPSIGYANLDLVINKSIALDEIDPAYDLSTAVFIKSPSISSFPSAWSSFPCTGPNDFGSYYDPLDPLNRFSPFIPLAAGDFITDTRLSTAIYKVSLDRETRVYVENFQPNGTQRNPSLILVTTFPNLEGSLSLDHTLYHDETYAFFDNEAFDSIAFYNFTSGFAEVVLNRLRPYLKGKHSKGDYNHQAFKYLGYNVAIGDLPSYSEGQYCACEKIYICEGRNQSGKIDMTNPLTWDKIYTKAEWDVPDKINGTNFEITNINEDWIYRDIAIEYEVKDNWETALETFSLPSTNPVEKVSLDKFKSKAGVADDIMSIWFKSSNQVIDNIFIPVTKGTNTLYLDGHFYGGSPVVIQSDFLPYIKIKSIKVVYTTKEKIQPFLISGKQTATAIDANNRIHVFFHNPSSQNISCAISGDLGASWWVFNDMIRLEEGDIAEQPYVICDKQSNDIFLFFKLNGRFLMAKRIRPEWFVCDDQFVVYKPPAQGTIFNKVKDVAGALGITSSVIQASNYDNIQVTPKVTHLGQMLQQYLDTDVKKGVNTTLKDLKDKLDVGLSEYSEAGKQLRRQPSYFVHGDVADQYFQTAINEGKLSNALNRYFALDIPPRWFFGGDPNGVEGKHMDNGFDLGSYAVYVDRRGKFRVVFSQGDGKISWKTSNAGLTHWYYDVRKAQAHMNFFTDKVGEADLSIDNPQVVYDPLQDDVYVFYFHKQMLFVRRFNNNLLYPDTANVKELPADRDKEFYANDRIKDHVAIVKDSTSLPLFLAGLIDAELAAGIKLSQASSARLQGTAATVAVDFRYDDPEAFLEGYEVDVTTKPVGYSLRNGVIRLLYRTSEGFVYGITLSGHIPTLDCRRRYKTD